MVQQEPTKNEKLKNSVIEILRNHKEVTCYSSGYINGYYTRTIFEERILKKEIIIKVLVVYMDTESSEIVQVNVDVENLYGGLLETSCFDGKDFNEIADEVVHFACVGD